MTLPVNDRIAWLCLPPDADALTVLSRQAGAAERGLPAGVVLVVDPNGALLGTVTDGDVRRAIVRDGRLAGTASGLMNPTPITFPESWTFAQILEGLPAELERRGRRAKRFLGKVVLVDEQRRPTRIVEYHQLWEQRVAAHRRVAVIGLGYVGLTLALVLAKQGLRVTGVDTDVERIRLLESGTSYVHEIGLPELLREQLGTSFRVSLEVPAETDVFVIAVGTPVVAQADGSHVPDLRYLRESATEVGKRLKSGDLVILRSTVPVGASREIVAPILEQGSGLRAGVDFHLAFAPERTIEGKALQELRTLPQIIGGLNADSVEATAALFRELTPTMVRVSSLEAAELVKLVNNGFRDHVFAFANELTRLAGARNLSAVEVIRAANQGYPRDPVPLPSPGVGGPCLTKDPYILAALAEPDARADTLPVRSRAVNEAMHEEVVTQLLGALRRAGKDPAKSAVLVCGLAFKGRPETGDLRNSSGVEIAKLLQRAVARLVGHDPVAPADELRRFELDPVSLPEGFSGLDAVVFLNNHPSYAKLDVSAMVRALGPRPVVYDGWNLLDPQDVLRVRPSLYLGLGFQRSSLEGGA